MSDPRPYTPEEMRNEFIKIVQTIVNYWAYKACCENDLAKCRGVAFSILSLLDGNNVYFPGTEITIRPHPQDAEYNKKMGNNWVEDGTILPQPLHEFYYTER